MIYNGNGSSKSAKLIKTFTKGRQQRITKEEFKKKSGSR